MSTIFNKCHRGVVALKVEQQFLESAQIVENKEILVEYEELEYLLDY